MKKYIKLFEEFINETDPLAGMGDLGGDLGGEEAKPKEDPLDKAKKEAEAKEKKAEKKHDKMIANNEKRLDDMLKDIPEIDKKLSEKLREALRKEDRVLIHNSVNDLIYLQQSLAQDKNTDAVMKITKLKELMDELDKSFTVSKRL
jgi:hypothetical protein